jgi:hypothetical protein
VEEVLRKRWVAVESGWEGKEQKRHLTEQWEDRDKLGNGT